MNINDDINIKRKRYYYPRIATQYFLTRLCLHRSLPMDVARVLFSFLYVSKETIEQHVKNQKKGIHHVIQKAKTSHNGYGSLVFFHRQEHIPQESPFWCFYLYSGRTCHPGCGICNDFLQMENTFCLDCGNYQSSYSVPAMTIQCKCEEDPFEQIG